MENLKISGEVVRGQRIGNTINFKTANINYKGCEEIKLGVYGCIVYGLDKEYFGVLNIGVRPTIEDEDKVSYEVHILEFDSEIYGEEIEVELLFFVRSEIKFNSLEDLKSQIEEDIVIVMDKFERDEYE